MKKVLLSGAAGVMGQFVREAVAAADDFTIVCGFDAKADPDADFPIYSDLGECDEDVDAIIDFSHFSAFRSIFDYAVEKKIPIVIATTGLTDEDSAAIAEGAKVIPVFKTANMSLGVNVMAKVLKDISETLKAYDVEIIEKHHHRKVDAPSGTAILLADAVNDGLSEKREFTYGRHGRDAKRDVSEIGIHAVRAGTIAGEHTVLYAGDDELIEIKHTALSRKIFANGALTAARFLADQKPGLYTMENVIGQ